MASELIAEGRRYAVGPGSVTIGRSPDNDIVLSHPEVSRHHATAWDRDNELTIRDEGSANGTWVNGRRVTAPTALRQGDQVGIGGVLLQVAAPEVPRTGEVPLPPPVGEPGPGRSALLVPLGIVGAVALVIVAALLVRWRSFGAALSPASTPSPTRQQTATTVVPTATTETSAGATEPASPPTSSPVATEPADVTTATPAPTGCQPDAAFVRDVSVPDGTAFSPGESFTKVWSVRSTGCTPWEPGTRLVFIYGDKMAAPDSVDVPDTRAGETADISVDMEAPASPGTYQGNWRLRSPDGEFFGDLVYVQIRVVESAPTPNTRSTVSVLIKNETGETVHLGLDGPESYEFTLPPGDQTIEVIPGTYEYEGRGCGGAIDSGTKTISESTPDWRWWCQ